MKGEDNRLNRECPAEIGELAEGYHLGHLSPEESAALEGHYIGCARCAAEMERAEAYISAIRAAAREILAKHGQASAAG